MMLNSYHQDFPILQTKSRGKPLVYLDSAATSQKPQTVIDSIAHYYHYDNANIHRGVYELSQRATEHYEASRYLVKEFINAAHHQEIIFVRGATEAINLVAQTFGRLNIQADDEIILTEMEHHSNIVPWQMLAESVGAVLKVVPIDDQGQIHLDDYENLFTPKTKFVSIVHASNVLGTINPIKKMITLAHQRNVPVLVDGAQAVPHMPVDVQDLNCDFYVFSSHKMYGPTGVGVLYGKTKWLELMPPYQGGGDMIETVSFTKTTFNRLPYKFEAGTPNISGVVALGAAIRYLTALGMVNVAAHEQALLTYATAKLAALPELSIIGTAAHKVGVISFVLASAHPHDVGTILDDQGIAVRAGHHCAMPVMQRYQIPATVRASFGIYNTMDDIDALVTGLLEVRRLFG